MEFALENPVILHIYGGEKPWIRLDGVGKLRKIQWWQGALQTPHFADELTEILLKTLSKDTNQSPKNQSPKIITSKTLKRFLKIAAKILPSSKARKQCRRLLNEC